MARYRIGNDMTILWTVNDRDGNALPLTDKEVHLYYTCERGRFEAEIEIQDTNKIVWNFYGGIQKTLGEYSLTLAILQSEGKRSIKKDVCGAFCLVGKDCEADAKETTVNGDVSVYQEVITTNLDISRIHPIIPTIVKDENGVGYWYVDGVNTGDRATGESAYEYAVSKGYEGSEEEFAEKLAVTPDWRATSSEPGFIKGKTHGVSTKFVYAKGTARELGFSTPNEYVKVLEFKPQSSLIPSESYVFSLNGHYYKVIGEGHITLSYPVGDLIVHVRNDINPEAHYHNMEVWFTLTSHDVGTTLEFGICTVNTLDDVFLNDTIVRKDELATINGLPLTDGGDIVIEVDSSLSTESVNPVENRVVTSELSKKLESEVVVSTEPTEDMELGKSARMVSVTHEELKNLRNNGELISGMQYRITDFVTTTAQENTRSAEHQFDVIVTADNATTLNEVARACLHEGDTYFSEARANLAAWQIWYCLDNDALRFRWADTESGKGVIYRMIDEWNNDCPYDFKNILFKRGIYSDGGGLAPKGKEDFNVYCYTFAWEHDEQIIKDSSIFGNNGDLLNDGEELPGVQGNIIKAYMEFDDDPENRKTAQHVLNDIVFLSTYGYMDRCFFGCNGNVFGTNCRSNSLSDECSYNIFGSLCRSNILGHYCVHNHFGNECGHNSFRDGCSYNVFGDHCQNNSFAADCSYNSLGVSCSYNIFDELCENNHLGHHCKSNIFEGAWQSNILGDNCENIGFYGSGFSNIFGNYCCDISLAHNYNSNIFGNYCCGISFEINDGAGSLAADVSYNTFGNGVQYVRLLNSYTSSSKNMIQYYKVANGTCGGEDGDGSPLDIEVERNNSVEKCIGVNSEGEVKIFCLADIIN